MVWDYDLETRHTGIDQDHQEVVAFLAAFLKVLDSRHDDRVPGALAMLYDRIAKHFAYEERLMVDRALPATAAHTGAHRSFLDDIRTHAERVATEGSTEAFRQWAHGQLVSWFRAHIKAHDLALAQALNEPGPTRG